MDEPSYKKQLPRGIRNNNPLNIRKGNNWQGEVNVSTDKEFEQFISMEFGIRAGMKILRNYMTGHDGKYEPKDTIDKIIRRWAPPIENATEAYILFVADSTGLNRYQKLNPYDRATMCGLVSAMIKVECGQTVDMAVIQSAYDLL